MNKKLTEQLVSLIKNLESFSGDEKLNLVEKLKYMPEWQMNELKDSLIIMHQEEEKYKSDVSRLELKYEMSLKKLIESDQE